MATSNKSVIFYCDWLDVFEDMNRSECGELVIALLKYGQDGSKTEFNDSATSMAFSILSKQINRDKQKYIETCDRNRKNAQKRWNNSKRKETTVCDGMRPHASDAIYADTDTDTDTDNDTDNDTDILNTIAHQAALHTENDTNDSLIEKEGNECMLNEKAPMIQKNKKVVENTISECLLKKPSIKEIESEFEELWTLYPNKKSKSKAMKSYVRARTRKKRPATYEQVKHGLDGYVKYIHESNIDIQYIKHGSTWFNQECWNDDYKIASKQNDRWY